MYIRSIENPSIIYPSIYVLCFACIVVYKCMNESMYVHVKGAKKDRDQDYAMGAVSVQRRIERWTGV